MKRGDLIKISSDYGPYKCLELKRMDISGRYGLFWSVCTSTVHEVLISGEVVRIFPPSWIEVISESK